MKAGDRVTVKDADGVDPVYRNRTGTVIADSAPGETIEIEFADETVSHSFNASDLNSAN